MTERSRESRMLRRQVVAAALMAFVAACSVIVPTSPAQDDLRVFDDVDLPQVPEEPRRDTPLPNAEELPVGDTLTDDSPVSLTSPDVKPRNESPDVRDEEDIGAGMVDLVPEEVVRERYPDGSVRIERGVAQDADENFINHGAWKNWDEDGNLIAEGAFQGGLRHGTWVRWYDRADAGLFSAPPFDLFTPPFRSQAEFRDGQLHGHWIITDKHDRKVCDWQYVDGRRHGVSSWYYPNANKMRELGYEFGEIDGDLIEWDHNSDVITDVEYQAGRRLDKTTKHYKGGQKQVEGMVLHARLVLKEADDWWNAKLATYRREGKDQKHGEWTAWFPNGQMKFSGSFVYGQPDGEFRWWYTNGQMSLLGTYQNGSKAGTWTWWHETGLKSIQGSYEGNSPVDEWIWWNENGRVAQRVDFSSARPVARIPTDNARKTIRSRRSG